MNRSLNPRLVARSLIALASLGAVLVLAYVDVERTSPGPVALAHARITDLDGGANCNACHGGWRTSLTQACLECHQPIAEQIDGTHGLHGTLSSLPASTSGAAFVTDPNACGRCHGEHHGASFTLVHERSFALAGVPDVLAFDHTRIGWTMEGKHTELECSECHANANVSQLLEGSQRYLGLDRSCASCHEDPHEGAFTQACATCHVQTSFEDHVPEDHDRHLPLTGAHAEQSCRACHEKGTAHSLEILAGGRARPPSRGCADCHESPHAAEFIDGIARMEGKPLARTCSVCHTSEHLEFRAEVLTLTIEQHSHAGFPLATPHALRVTAPESTDTPANAGGVTCAECHDPDLSTFEERYPGRRPMDCAVCHTDPHAGQFTDGKFADPSLTGGGCVTCHAMTTFTPHHFDLEDHTRAEFELDGAHAELACDECHVVPEPEAPRRFNGTATRCERCHDDAHEGAFDALGTELALVEAGECARCHGTGAFTGVEDFDHGHFTGFPLQGAHAEGACESCHAPAAEPDRFGRSFGRVSALFPEVLTARPTPEVSRANSDAPRGAEVRCAHCHADPHGASFQKSGDASDVLAAGDCARCHEEVSFRALPNGFDHGAETGFALDGAHGAASCSACHAPLATSTPNGRTMAEAAGSRCVDCHADPHGGQFSRADPEFPEGGVDCSRCHDPSGAFSANTFDHTWDTDFPLDGSHVSVACAKCHKTERVAAAFGSRGGTTSLVRYRPVPKQCADCHGDQAGTLRRRVNGRSR